MCIRDRVCKDCGKEFVFSAGEQAFYAEKGFENEPARCHECRDKRRREREGGKEQRQMYTVECAECGKETQDVYKRQSFLCSITLNSSHQCFF